MKLSAIGYLSEPIIDWNKGLDAAASVDDLVQLASQWRGLCSDAEAAARQLTQDDFKDWKKALYLERHGRFMGVKRMEKFGAILLPRILLIVGMTAQQFHAPWGCAYIRMRDVGHLVEKDGIAVITKDQEGHS